MKSRSLLDRRKFILGTGAAGIGMWAGVARLRGESGPGQLIITSLPDPLEKCNVIWDASYLGYQVDEYLVSGSGTTFKPIDDVEAGKADHPNLSPPWGERDHYTTYAANLPADFSPRPQTGTGSYTTRIIVYRPRDMKKFSGNVIVEPFHSQGSLPSFSVANRFFIARGDAAVHISVPGLFPSMKKYSAERYGQLSMPDRSVFWSSVSQIATLLKLGGPNSPLPVPARHLYMTGYSGSADTTYIFASYHHRLTRMPDGKPVFSGYLPMSHLMVVPPMDAVIVTAATMCDYLGATDGDTPATRAFRPKFDSDAPDARRRRYEVPGAFHGPFQPPEPGMAIPLLGGESGAGEGGGEFAACKVAQKWPREAETHHVHNRAILEACFHHASRWVEDGVAPPRAPIMETDETGKFITDENGNIKGGLRFPEIAVPMETFVPAAQGGEPKCGTGGYSLPFSREKLVALYGTRDKYLAQYDAAADQLLKAGYILPEGATQLKVERRWQAPVF